jgi:prepilin-type N-terminal cleavage/methylation domain-containing protein
MMRPVNLVQAQMKITRNKAFGSRMADVRTDTGMRGFTLLELSAVVTIIAVLVSLL